jgi:two-component system response regulator AtoC
VLESELFGHVRGAFTDAGRDKKGLFVEANGGTLFLDEIGELPLSLQVKLLRVLQENEVRRVGDTKTIAINARIIAAGARPLSELVKNGEFREDLFYRLNVMPIRVPPLRERPEDIPLLSDHFIRKFRKTLGSSVKSISPAARRALMKYHWPGNVRELENAIERAMVMAEGSVIRVDSLPDQVRTAEDSVQALLRDGDLSIKRASKALERMLIEKALRKTKGNRTKASGLLEISHRALLYKIRDYDLADID